MVESLKVKAGKALGQGKACQGKERFPFDFEQLTLAESLLLLLLLCALTL